MSVPALQFVGVSAGYGSGPSVLRGLDLEVQAGERVALLGLNGSGKTTLLKAAVGLVSHEGRILVCGERLTHRSLKGIRDQVGFLFNQHEDQLLFPCVLDDVAFGPRRRGASLAGARAAALRALEDVGSVELAEREIHQLSHGQKQRVALAGILATAPPLLLLDEPSAALDPPGKRQLAERLAAMSSGMLIATHDLAFAQGCCTRALHVAGGQVVACREIGGTGFLCQGEA